MDERGLSEKVRRLIFEHIDSVEEIEVLLALKAQAPTAITAEGLVRELRSSQTSVHQRLANLQRACLIQTVNDAFQYAPDSESLEAAVDELEVAYKQRRQKVLELIFSPAKRARSFANAFKIGGGCGEGADDA